MKLVTSLLASLALVTTASTDRCEEANPQELTGREMFLQFCSPCHGEDARGYGPVAIFVRPGPPDLTRLGREGRFDERHLTEIIDGRRGTPAHGTRQMPVWGAIFEEQLHGRPNPPYEAYLRTRTLVEYLRSIQEE